MNRAAKCDENVSDGGSLGHRGCFEDLCGWLQRQLDKGGVIMYLSMPMVRWGASFVATCEGDGDNQIEGAVSWATYSKSMVA